MKSLISSVALGMILAVANCSGALADCRECGCHQCTKKVCRVECGTEEKTVTCYGCKCEDFCIPGPSCKVGCVCEPDPCCPCESHPRSIWKPGCAEVRTRKVLVKKDVKVTVQKFKWTVEEVCCGCRHVCSTVEAPSEAAAKQLAGEPAAETDEGEQVKHVAWFSKLFTK